MEKFTLLDEPIMVQGKTRKFNKSGWNNCHPLFEDTKLRMQNEFIFFDTETKRTFKSDKEEHQRFYMGWACHWSREGNHAEWKFFSDKKCKHVPKGQVRCDLGGFWDWVESKVPPEPKNQRHKAELIVYAHNTEFDFKVSHGWDELVVKMGWKVDAWRIEGKMFMLVLTKGRQRIKFWDTGNYFQTSLENLGKAVGQAKMSLKEYGGVTNQKIPDDVLSKYCKNDVEVCFVAIKKLIGFLLDNDLTCMRPTAASLALGAFKHRFYKRKRQTIWIHDNSEAIFMEREGYKGGLTDCFQIGEFSTETGHDLFDKLDVNSMYPHVMRTHTYPVKMIDFCAVGEQVGKMRQMMKAGYDVIADALIELPEDKAYILHKVKYKGENKSLFVHGKYWTVLTTPELKFVEKYGKIHSVRRMAYYESKPIFDEFVDFFYSKKVEFGKKVNGVAKNSAFKEICKLFLNSLYGKWGQKKDKYILVATDLKPDFWSINCLDDRKLKLGDYDGYNLMKDVVCQMGDKGYRIQEGVENADDSFVAIAAHVTAYARMYLVEMTMKLGRDEIFYEDTDSLVVDRKATPKLKEYMDDGTEILGKLKLEGTADRIIIYRPKYYVFNDSDEAERNVLARQKDDSIPKYNPEKCKGIKKDARKVYEDDLIAVFEQDMFEKFRTSVRKKSLDFQRIRKVQKQMLKTYTKGHVVKGMVKPFSAKYLGIQVK